MVSLRSIALLALLALLATTVEAESLRIGAAATFKSISRELSSLTEIAGYEPKTDVSDHVSRIQDYILHQSTVLSLTYNVFLLVESYRQGSGHNSVSCEEREV
jgi:hypothetical protein